MPVRPFSPEQGSLFNAAEFTWRRRAAATSAGMPFGEETITETILLDLKLSYPGNLEIIPFSKPAEGKIGADWEWCFASHDHQFFERMLVQAKVLDDPEFEYAHVDRKIGNTGVRQIDRLIATSSTRGVPAMYAFYNHVTDINRLPSDCATIGIAKPNPLPACWGISIASAKAVLGSLPDKTFDTLSSYSIPLHCLLCTGGTGASGPMGSPGSVANALTMLTTVAGFDEGDPAAPREPSRDPPYYFDVASRFSANDSGERERIRERLAKENPEIDGIAVFVDGEKKGRVRPQRLRSEPDIMRVRPARHRKP